jgi:hypothetical protein
MSHNPMGLHGLLDSSTFYPQYLEGVSSIRNLGTRHALVTRDACNTDHILLGQQIESGVSKNGEHEKRTQ